MLEEITALPDKQLVKNLDQRHQEWQVRAGDWERMSLLYSGGCDIKAAAEQFLVRRPKEISEVFTARVERFSYHNHIGVAVDWYLAALFEKPASIEPTDGVKLNEEQEGFYGRFSKNCDRKGTPFMEKFREMLKNLLVFRRSYMLLDLPPKMKEYATAAEERAEGQLDPYVCVYDPRQAINWACDDFGNLEWVIFTVRSVKTQPFGPSVMVDRWYFYDRHQFGVYERVAPPNEQRVPDDAEANLVASGLHALSERNRVPVKCVELPEALWLMNRAYLPAQDHLNTDNVLGWALQMAALAMPVVKCDSDVQPTLSEAGFLQLPFQSDYAWTEPEGKSFAHLADRAKSLVEDIYRSFYLLSQARSTAATPAAQSGISKQQDMTPSKKVLNLFGDYIRATIQAVMDDVSLIRSAVGLEAPIVWDARGFEFPEDPADGEIKTVSDAMALNIPSVLAERELYKKIVDVLFPDVNPEVKTAMYDEIDAAPSREERMQKAMELKSGSIAGRFGSAGAKL